MQYFNLAFAALVSTALAQSSSTGSAASACEAQNNACVTAPNANFSYCASQYAGCLASAGTSTIHPTSTASCNGTVVTSVVTSYTTYCPAPTVITHGTNEITVTAAGIVTVTDCPCTLTLTIPATQPFTTLSNSTIAIVKPTVTKPAVFTGAANVAKPVAGLLALGAGALAFL